MNHSNVAFTHTQETPECNNVSVMQTVLCPAVRNESLNQTKRKCLMTTEASYGELKVKGRIFSLPGSFDESGVMGFERQRKKTL